MREATDDGLKARAGVLTLLFMTSDRSREELLRMLHNALSGGALRQADPDAYEEDEDDEDDEEEFDLDLDEEIVDDEAEPPDEIDLEEFGTHARARATPAGEEFLFVAFTLQRWLRSCPRGPLEIGVPDAGDAIAALLCGWSATVTHGLAARTRTLSELDEVVAPLEFEILDEHIVAMERSGLAEARSNGDDAIGYAATMWLREGLAPIAAAARHEFHHPLGDTLPPDRLDVEAAFQLALPLVVLPRELSGSCRLDVRLDDGREDVVSATAQVKRGRVVAVEAQPGKRPDAWAAGSTLDWLDTVVDPRAARLEAGGEPRLVKALVEGLYDALFSVPVR
jgi:hypothetical protein